MRTQSRNQSVIHFSCLISGLVMWSLWTPIPTAIGQQEFKPYLANVIVDQAKIYAGPADIYYPTEALPSGTQVEVYQHDPDGWCAIRPTPNSFSLVLADDIELLSDEIARIVNDDAKCWVGTELEEADQPLWQIRLQKGEKLRLKGVVKEQYVLEAGQPDWVQVAPPKGEFRWIHISNITRVSDLPTRNEPLNSGNRKLQSTIASADGSTQTNQRNDHSVLSEIELGNNSLDQNASFSKQNRSAPTPASEFDIVERGHGDVSASSHSTNGHLTNSGEVDSAHSDTFNQWVDNSANDQSGGWRASSRSIKDIMPEIEIGNDAVVQNANDNGFEYRPSTESTIASVAPVSLQQNIANPTPLPPLDPKNLSSNVQRMELQLTQLSSKDPQDWNLEPLLSECRYCIQNSNDPSERQGAERLLEKLLQFQRIQAGYATSGKNWPTQNGKLEYDAQVNISESRGAQSDTALQGDGSANSISEPKLAGNFDAVGVLNEMIRDNGRTRPAYVLQDENGKIIHHIAPAPGVNLHRYLKKNIAVQGQRGFHQQLKMSHITAERVVELEPVVRR